MKMNKITVMSLVLTSLVTVDAGAAWSRAGQFARKVLLSKTGAVAAASSVGYLGWLDRQLNLVEKEEPVDFSENVHKEMQHFLEIRGVRNCSVVFGRGPCAFKHKNEAYISFPSSYKSIFGVERQLPKGFEKAGFFNFSNQMREFDPILEEVMAVSEHEASHLAHNDQFQCYARAPLPLISMLMGKAMSVAGKGRLVAVGSCLATGISGWCLCYVWHRCAEKRCDLAASSSESALHAVNFFEKKREKKIII